MDILLHVAHVLTALGLIGLILIQHGKGADAGASFGGGSSQTVFGSAGSANFLTRATAVLAALFFVTSMGLAWYARQQAGASQTFVLPAAESVDREEEPEVPTLGAADESAVPVLEQQGANAGQDTVESPAAGAGETGKQQ
ncbi:MAG: preprotein translocase subunit SecG [Alcanivoracaceae bacterium]|jgi:preprotein translocase subunit SecG|nr:preprotein translocase subunit SecG [Alcanivoracaceae bacterium]